MKNKKNLINALQKDEANRLFKDGLMSIRGGANEGTGTALATIQPGCTVCKKTCSMCVGGGMK